MPAENAELMTCVEAAIDIMQRCSAAWHRGRAHVRATLLNIATFICRVRHANMLRRVPQFIVLRVEMKRQRPRHRAIRSRKHERMLFAEMLAFRNILYKRYQMLGISSAEYFHKRQMKSTAPWLNTLSSSLSVSSLMAFISQLHFTRQISRELPRR